MTRTTDPITCTGCTRTVQVAELCVHVGAVCWPSCCSREHYESEAA